jgi:ribosomal protein L11 methyltransferase
MVRRPVNCGRKLQDADKTMISRPLSPSSTAVARLETDEQSAHRVSDLVAESLPADEIAVAFVDIGAGRWRVAMYFRTAPDETIIRALTAAAAGSAAAKALRFERVAATDWVRESLAGLAPVSAGRFIVHGSHDRARIPHNRIGIEIEAALAFGTGHHGTTRGCLVALDRLCKVSSRPRRAFSSPCKGEDDPSSARIGWGSVHLVRTPTRLASARRPPPFRGRKLDILDLGTGSGVLAIAAARALRQRVLATDIDGSAVRAARANAALNRAGGFVEVIKADGVTAPKLRHRAPYDLILANILLRPLQRLAAPLTRLTAPGARVVLSGLLASQANAAIAAYRGLALERRIDLDGWTTLILVRRRRPRANVARGAPAP